MNEDKITTLFNCLISKDSILKGGDADTKMQQFIVSTINGLIVKSAGSMSEESLNQNSEHLFNHLRDYVAFLKKLEKLEPDGLEKRATMIMDKYAPVFEKLADS